MTTLIDTTQVRKGNPFLPIVLAKIADHSRKESRQMFSYWFGFALHQSNDKYAMWKQRNNLHDLAHESVIALVRAGLEANRFDIPMGRWFHCACLVREGREFRRVRAVAARFQPMKDAAE